MKRNIWGGPTATSITPEQCRAARERLDWSVETLAKSSGYTADQVASFEAGEINLDPEPIIAAFAEYGGHYF